MPQLSPRESAILKTVVYFDLFDYPLTLLELYQNLPAEKAGDLVGLDLSELERIISQSDFLKRKLQSHNGFYFLSGREDIIAARQDRYRCFLKKMRRAKRLIFFLRFVPYIKGVAICNSLSFANALSDSDIDFFILTKPGALWSARGWAIILAELLGRRPAPGKTKDAYCLSFFAAENADLNTLRLTPEDVYFDWWAANLLPIYNKDNAFEKFFAANQWLKDCRPNAVLKKIAGRFYCHSGLPRRTRVKAGPRAGIQSHWIDGHRTAMRGDKRIERFWRVLQTRRLPTALKTAANTSGGVVINDQVLKFHWPDKREEYRERFERRVRGVKENVEFSSPADEL
ncbi:MAG: hypothetical protein Q8M83_06330 [bacterium]|nr:hypothetical protein [bacterium]